MPKPLCASCSRPERVHPWDEPERGESCALFVAVVRPQRGTRRSIRKYAIGQQGQWAKAAGFVGREGHGADAVYYGPDGRVAIIAEHKHMARMSWADVQEAIDQAHSYRSAGEYGAAGITTKPGPGKKARRYIIFEAEDWPGITERLGEC